MERELIRFRQIVRYLISQGGVLTKITSEVGLTWPTMNIIMEEKPQNFRASTKALIQDFIKKHNSVPESNIKLSEIKEDIDDSSDDLHFGVLGFFVRVRELLQNVPKGYKCKIEIEKI